MPHLTKQTVDQRTYGGYEINTSGYEMNAGPEKSTTLNTKRALLITGSTPDEKKSTKQLTK